jgi:predicted RNase H-like HicB family nuclease
MWWWLMANFTVIWEQEKIGEYNGYSGRCLEISGIISKGETLEELKSNMIDAITHALKSMHKEAQEKEMIIEVPD